MELRMEIYIMNKVLNQNINYEIKILWKDIYYSKIPLKHKLVLILEKIKFYNKLYPVRRYFINKKYKSKIIE